MANKQVIHGKVPYSHPPNPNPDPPYSHPYHEFYAQLFDIYSSLSFRTRSLVRDNNNNNNNLSQLLKVILFHKEENSQIFILHPKSANHGSQNTLYQPQTWQENMVLVSGLSLVLKSQLLWLATPGKVASYLKFEND